MGMRLFFFFLFCFHFRVVKDIAQFGLKREKVNRQDIIFMKKVNDDFSINFEVNISF